MLFQLLPLTFLYCIFLHIPDRCTVYYTKIVARLPFEELLLMGTIGRMLEAILAAKSKVNFQIKQLYTNVSIWFC